jgi:hypothetical protein
MNASNLKSPSIMRSASPLNDTPVILRTSVIPQPRLVVSNDEAQRLAREWIAAWNARDFPRLAAMHANRCELSSPLIAIIMGRPNGRLLGKRRILAFWQCLCAREEKIDYELFAVYRGVGTVAIHYRSFLGKNALEIMELDDFGRIVRSASSFDQLS